MRAWQPDITPETIHRLRRGDQEAFRTIYQSLNQQLYLFAKTYIARDDEAEDATADTFVALWSNRSDFDNLPAVIGFLRKTLKNRCLDYLRHESVKSRHYNNIIQLLGEETGNDFSLEMIRLEVLNAIYAQADKLPQRTREVFLLSFRDGLKPAEIAARLNTNIQTVRNQKLSAIRLLRQALHSQPLIIALLSTFVIFVVLIGTVFIWFDGTGHHSVASNPVAEA